MNIEPQSNTENISPDPQRPVIEELPVAAEQPVERVAAPSVFETPRPSPPQILDIKGLEERSRET